MSHNEQTIEELLTRGVAEVIEREHLKKRLLAGEKLRVKLGIDPTSPHIHLGRAVTLLKLRDFQNLGCQIIFIVGDFTGQIGDTSDKESERPMLSEDLVKKNMATYLEQAGKILDMQKVEVKYNSSWLEKVSLQELGEYASAFSLSEFIARENIKKRLESGKRVSLREVLYPLMQGYDSVQVKADVELGGTDQKFNMLSGRTLQKALATEAQDILMLNLIAGTDGRKMSSSWGNTINLTDTPEDMFGKVMSLPDTLIFPYFIHCTRLSLVEIEKMEKEMKGGANPRDFKLRLAKEIVTRYHGEKASGEAEQNFIHTFSEGKIPENIREEKPQYEAALEGYENMESFIARVGLAKSKSDARRKIKQGGVEFDGKKLGPGENFRMFTKADNGKVLKVGKKDFVKIVF